MSKTLAVLLLSFLFTPAWAQAGMPLPVRLEALAIGIVVVLFIAVFALIIWSVRRKAQRARALQSTGHAKHGAHPIYSE